jgi:hypothetical protein
MADYVSAKTDSGANLFLHAGILTVSGINTASGILKDKGDNSSLVLGKSIYSNRSSAKNNITGYQTYLCLSVPKYMPIATMVCQAFGAHDTIKELTIKSVGRSPGGNEITGTFEFEDGQIEDYSINSNSIEINFLFSKLTIEDKLSNTMGVSDSRTA